MKVVATIQARMGSQRLPGKVLREINGQPMLHWQVLRVRQSRLIDDVVVATTTSARDDLIEAFCLARDIECYRGPEDDVLSRLAGCISARDEHAHVECFGDSPLVDPQILDEFIGYFLKFQTEVDLVSSTLETTYPPGLEVLVYSSGVLLDSDRRVPKSDPLREHGGYNITRFPDLYRLRSLVAPERFYRPDTYLEVDTLEDFVLVSAIFEHFRDARCQFGLAEILRLLDENPALASSNQSIPRRWKALRRDVD